MAIVVMRATPGVSARSLATAWYRSGKLLHSTRITTCGSAQAWTSCRQLERLTLLSASARSLAFSATASTRRYARTVMPLPPGGAWSAILDLGADHGAA